MRGFRVCGDRVAAVLDGCWRKGVVPVSWQHSEGVQLDKHNGKAGPQGIRVINKSCPLGKCCNNMLFKKMTPPGSRSRSPSPDGNKKKKGKGKGKGGGLKYCNQFHDTGVCNREGCKFPHLTKEEVKHQRQQKGASS